MGKSERNVAVSHKGQGDAQTLLLFNWSASTKPKVGELQRISHTGTNSSNSFLPPTEGKGPRNHTATGCFVLEETSKTHPPFNSCHRQGHLHLIKAARMPSSVALSTSRDGAATATLGNLFQCPTTLIVNNFLLIPNLNLSSFSASVTYYYSFPCAQHF